MRDRTDIPEHLDRLRALYEGASGAPPPATGDEARELEELRRMKALLDARPRRRPDSAAVSAVLAAARGEAVPRGRRADRAPAARQRSVGLRVGAVSAVLAALLLLVSVFELDLVESRGPGRTLTAETNAVRSGDSGAVHSEESYEAPNRDAAETAAAPPVSGAPSKTTSRSDDLQRSFSEEIAAAPSARSGAGRDRSGVDPQHGIDPGARGLQPLLDDGAASRRLAELRWQTFPLQAFQRNAANAPPGPHAPRTAGEDVLSWDQRDDVMEVYQQIQIVGGGVESEWGPAPVPLEMLPTTGKPHSTSLQQAGDRRKP